MSDLKRERKFDDGKLQLDEIQFVKEWKSI